MPRKTQEDAATELALALGLLMRRVRSAAPAESHELSWTQKAVMVRLDGQGPATIAELARAEGVKPQSMGATVAALEEMGIVERKPHPTDGRQMNIALTTKGARVRRDARIAKQTWLAQSIAKLDAAEQKKLPALTALIKRLGEL
jgi:DNA-binding MarR family transcriptional regulator